MSVTLTGIGVARGIIIGRAHHLGDGTPEVVERRLSADAVEAEVVRFRQAREEARGQLRTIRNAIPSSAPQDISAFIDSHLLMLDDTALSSVVEGIIRDQRCNAEWALKCQHDSVVQVFEAMDDAYLRTRKDDVSHAVDRIQRILAGHDRPLPDAQDDTPAILIADDLSPADLVTLHNTGLAAFITESGGPLSHTAILARSFGIPAIVGLRNARQLLQENEQLILDGHAGAVIAGPDTAQLAEYQQRQHAEWRHVQELAKLKTQPSITCDQQNIALRANIELTEDLTAATEFGATGIGLYRTEFLYLGRDKLPSEEEHLAAYRAALAAANGEKVTVRTLDLGADKQLDPTRPIGGNTSNPALGLRAIRLCLQQLDLFRPQLRALLRAAVDGPLQIMLPMICNLGELQRVFALIEELKQELRRDGLAHREDVPIGVMIEVPAAALAADLLAPHVSFFSIGTNDLIQYALAIDRIDDTVNYLYDPLHPAVLRLIQMTIQAGQKANIPVAMCGEMAGDIRYTRLLLGLGLTEFSMHPASLLEVKHIVKQSDVQQLQTQIQPLLHSADAANAAELLAKINLLSH